MVEGAALGVVVVAVGAAADDHLALVGLAHVAVHGVGHDDAVHDRLDGLGDQRLERDGFDRQAEARHVREVARVAGDHDAELVAVDLAPGGVDACDAVAVAADAGDLALLDDVDAHVGAGAGVSPGHGVVAGGAGAGLPEAAEDRVARAVEVDDRHDFLDPLGAHEFRVHALQRVGVGGAAVAADLVLGLGEHEHAAGRVHDVVVQVLAHGLVETARLLVDRGGGVLQVVGADDGGVAAGVAAPEPALFDHRHIGDSEVLAEVVGRGEPVAAGADDDHVVALFRLCLAPGPFPALVVGESLPGDGKDGVAFHGPRIRIRSAWDVMDPSTGRPPITTVTIRHGCDMAA